MTDTLRRLRIVANKILQNLPSEKREGSAVAAGALREMTQDKNKSSSTALSLLSKIDTAADVMERLKSQPDGVIADLKQLRTAREATVYDSARTMLTSLRAVSTTKGMRVSVAGDILTLEQPLSSWKTEFKVSTVRRSKANCSCRSIDLTCEYSPTPFDLSLLEEIACLHLVKTPQRRLCSSRCPR